jgi:hypothetical protein
MSNKTPDYTKEILKANKINGCIDSITVKEKKIVMKKLKKTLKDLEFLRRMGGVTLIVEGSSIITTYHNNSINRKINVNIKKVIY